MRGDLRTLCDSEEGDSSEKNCFTGGLCSSGLVLECASRRCLFCINIRSQKLSQYAVQALFLKVDGPGD